MQVKTKKKMEFLDFVYYFPLILIMLFINFNCIIKVVCTISICQFCLQCNQFYFNPQLVNYSYKLISTLKDIFLGV